MNPRPFFLFALFVVLCIGSGWALAASSQKFYCSVQADMAEAMERDFRMTELKPEHFQNENQNFLARRVARCMADGEEVRACVVRQCMQAQKEVAIAPEFQLAGSSGLSRRERACYEKLGDEYVIASSRVLGMSREVMTEHIRNASPQVDEARTARRFEVFAPEVWASADPIEWFNAKFRPCIAESTSALAPGFVRASYAQLTDFRDNRGVARLSRAQAVYSLAVAWGQYHGPQPPGLPVFRIVTPVDVNALLRKAGACGKCAAEKAGFFYEGVVYLSNALDFRNQHDEAKLIHELVHYLQWLQYGSIVKGVTPEEKKAACLQWQDREREAYQIQIHILEKSNLDSRYARFAMQGVAFNCAE